MSEKMYRISSLNSLYYVWSDMTIEKIRHNAEKLNEKAQRCMKEQYKSYVDVSECSITEPLFNIRYSSQPLYSWYESVDRYNCAYIQEICINKQKFITEHNIKEA